jgi:hypothetical protein
MTSTYCKCGDPKGMGHYFNKDMRCHLCGRRWSKHRVHPSRCPKAHTRYTYERRVARSQKKETPASALGETPTGASKEKQLSEQLGV